MVIIIISYCSYTDGVPPFHLYDNQRCKSLISASCPPSLAVTPAFPGSWGPPAPVSLLLLQAQLPTRPPTTTFCPYLKRSLSNVFARLCLMSARRLTVPDSTSPVWMVLGAQPDFS